MEHQDKGGPDGPQSVWQSLHQQEEGGMEMRLTTDELCAKARFRERDNVWFQWMVALVCLGFGALFVYRAVTVEQIWLRLASAWMVILLALMLWVGIRVGTRRLQVGESCAQFMVRELDGSRRTALAIQRGFVLAIPSALMAWWGASDALTSPWRMVAILLVLLACSAGLGKEARKKAREAEELRRAIGG